MPRDRVSGLTLIELLIVVALLGILVSAAAPILLRARNAGDLAVAVASLRTIHSAQSTFASACGRGRYASSLPDLMLAPPGGSPFIAPDLGAASEVHKAGFAITMTRGTDGVAGTEPSCNGLAPSEVFSTFYATATPTDPAMAGPLHLWVGVDGTVFGYADPINWTRGGDAPPVGSPIGSGGRFRPGKIDVPETPGPGSPPP